jgi:hypothetical protein
VFAPNANDMGHNAAPEHNVDATVTPPPSTFQPGVTPTTQILD